MPLMLCKCDRDDQLRLLPFEDEFSAAVEDPDVDRYLRGLPDGDGNWDRLEGDEWLVVEAFERDLLPNGGSMRKFCRGNILYRGGPEGLEPFQSRLALTSRAAYYWAKHIGHREVMRERVDQSRWAYWWARHFGDHDIMRDRVTDSEYSYCWALNIGDKEIMRDRVTESQWAWRWALAFGDHPLCDRKMEAVDESED